MAPKQDKPKTEKPKADKPKPENPKGEKPKPENLNAEKPKSETTEHRIKEDDGLLFVESGFDPEKKTCAKSRAARCEDCQPCEQEKGKLLECVIENSANYKEACKPQEEAHKKCEEAYKNKAKKNEETAKNQKQK